MNTNTIFKTMKDTLLKIASVHIKTADKLELNTSLYMEFLVNLHFFVLAVLQIKSSIWRLYGLARLGVHDDEVYECLYDKYQAKLNNILDCDAKKQIPYMLTMSKIELTNIYKKAKEDARLLVEPVNTPIVQHSSDNKGTAKLLQSELIGASCSAEDQYCKRYEEEEFIAMKNAQINDKASKLYNVIKALYHRYHTLPDDLLVAIACRVFNEKPRMIAAKLIETRSVTATIQAYMSRLKDVRSFKGTSFTIMEPRNPHRGLTGMITNRDVNINDVSQKISAILFRMRSREKRNETYGNTAKYATLLLERRF